MWKTRLEVHADEGSSFALLPENAMRQPAVRMTAMPARASVFVWISHSRMDQRLANIRNEYSNTATTAGVPTL